MKAIPKSLFLILAILTGFASLTAEPEASGKKGDPFGGVKEAAPTGPRYIRVQVDYFEMSLETMADLLDDKKATESDEILRSHVRLLVKEGKASIVDTQLLIARSGQKATTESIREFIYPTEYEPSEISNVVRVAGDGSKTEGADPTLATGPTPSAFETRNLGSTLEIEPLISADSKYIDLRLAPELVYHNKNITYASWKDKRGTADVVMPEMYTLRVNTALTTRNGQYALVTAHSPRDKNGHVDYSRKIMVFVRSTIIEVK